MADTIDDTAATDTLCFICCDKLQPCKFDWNDDDDDDDLDAEKSSRPPMKLESSISASVASTIAWTC
jgi:hypothetical protein